MTTRRILNEAGTISKPAEGATTYPVRIISEGKGSSGTYTRAMLEENIDAFTAALSFMNHPLDPEKPHLRPAEDIAGRLVGAVEGKEVDGVYGLYGEYKPNSSNPQRAAFIEEYADALGLSIYIAGTGKVVEGEYMVESFDGADPYRSVDIVVAAGRGGRFERATESYRTVEGNPDPTFNGSATAVSEAEKKGKHMDEIKDLFTAFTASVDAKFVALEAKVDSVITLSESATDAKTVRVEALAVADKLATAKLSENGRKRVLESVTGGTAVEDAILAETALRDEYLAEAKADATPAGRVVEGADNSKDDFTVNGLS
jgi:hypothetical protein